MGVLLDKIRDLLEDFRGPEPLRELFWEVLGYDRVNESLPDGNLPGKIHSQLTDARLLAQHDDFYVIYARLSGSHTEPWVEREFALRTQRRFPFAAFVFSNFGQSQWEFVYGKVRRDRFGAKHGLAHLPVGTIDTDYDRVAKALLQIRAYGPNDEPLPTLGLAEAYERAFDLANGRWERIVAEAQADGTGLYLNDIGRYPLLSPTEERRLIEQIDAAGPVAMVGRSRLRLVEPHKRAEFIKQRNDLVTGNLRLAVHIAKDFRGRHLELTDLAQEGCIGLLRAAELVDKSRGTRFTTYAYYWAQQHIRRAKQVKERLIRIPVHILDQASTRRDSLQLPHVVSLHTLSREQKNALIDRSLDPIEETALSREQRELIATALDRLRNREAEILRLRFGWENGHESTLDEVGKRFGVTRERIRQIEAKALKRLKIQLMASRYFEEFRKDEKPDADARHHRQSKRKAR